MDILTSMSQYQGPVSTYEKKLINYTIGINFILIIVSATVVAVALLISYPVSFHYLRYVYLALALSVNFILIRKDKTLLAKILTLLEPFLFVFLFPILFDELHSGMFLWFPYGLIIVGAASFLIFSWDKEKILLHVFFTFFILCSIFFDELLISKAQFFPGTKFLYIENHLYYLLSKVLLTVFIYTAMYSYKFTTYKDQKRLELLNNELANFNKNLEGMVKDRTFELEKKNQKIRDLTYANSHRIRSSVARITGLIYLTEINPSSEDKETYYQKIKETADEIEKETAKISWMLSDDLKLDGS